MAFRAATAVLLAFCAAACSRRGAVGSDSSGTRDASRPVPSGAAGTAEAFDAEADAQDAPPAAVEAARRDPGDGFRSFRAGRLRSGRAPAAAPRRPEIRWTFRTKDAIGAQPVVAADGTALVASLDGTLYALSPDGSLRWTFPAGDRIYSTPWIADSGQVVFGSDADRLHALDPSGKVQWTMLRPDDAERPDLHDVDTAPVATRSAVYVGAGLYLYSLDMEGLVRWRVATGGKVFSSPALLPDGTIVVGSQDGHLWAVRPDGTVRWKYRTRGDVDSTPAVDEAAEAIYVGSDDGMVHAVSFRGARLWATEVGGFVRTGPAIGPDGTVYATTFGPVARLQALDPDGGWVRWTVEAGRGPSAEFGIRSSPIVASDGVVLFGAPGGSVRAVTRDGEPLWSVDVPSDVDGGPILVQDGTIYFGTDDGTFYAAGDAPH